MKNKAKEILSKMIKPPIKLAGLDIGSSSIKIMEIEGETLETARLKSYHIEPLPAELVQFSPERNVDYIEQVGEIVKRCWKRSGISTKNMVIALPNLAIIDKKEVLPLFDGDDEMLFQVEQSMTTNYLPSDITPDDIVLDYSVREQTLYEEGKNDILMVAAKKNQIDELVGIVESAGLVPYILDVEKYAMQNLVALMKGEEYKKQTYLLLDTGATTLRMLIIRNGEIIYARDTDLGGRNLTIEIMRELDVDYAEAEKIKIDRTHEKFLEIETLFIDNYIAEFFRAFQYFTSSAANADIDEVILLGGVATTPGFTERMKRAIKENNETAIKTEPYIAHPLRHMPKESKITMDKFLQDESRLFLVTSLALRQFLRRY